MPDGLTIQNLSAWYVPGKPVLDGFSLRLQEHEVLGLMGLNGAGKTTLLQVLSGLHGSFCADGVKWKGTSVSFREERFKKCRYMVFAEDNSFSFFTFWEYLSYVFRAYKKTLPNVEDLIRGFGFEAYTEKLLGELSMGNRKKAFLITAFALKPELLFLDEPVNGLDFSGTEFLYRQIKGYGFYGTLLFTSHILESVTLTADRALVLREGRIGQSFSREEMEAEAIRTSLGNRGCEELN
ncbi:MAG: ABC transporter ATP-binding protein [Lachnospiraceae bacterium]|jgi:ABC-2 type transport system ATP-binding protein|nr:ABC transporter ATP-binding protein [Lachnospiraceae bacterium]